MSRGPVTPATAAGAMEPSEQIESHRIRVERHPQRMPTPSWQPGRIADRLRGLTLVEAVLVVAIVAVLVTLVASTHQGYRDRLKVDQAVGDIVMIATSVTEFRANNRRLPADLAEVGKSGILDPWGNPYQYVNHETAPKGQFRKDKNIVPINSDFDLFSAGKDGASVGPLTAKSSRDDIIRANDGAFIGLSSSYDP